MQVINLDRSTHETVQRLLPWYVSEALQEEERTLVQEHVQGCSQCQADIEWEKKFRGVVAADPGTPLSSLNVEQALMRLQPQLENRGIAARMRNLLRAASDGWHYSNAGMRLVVAMQFLAIGGLCVSLWLPLQRDASFHALGSAQAHAANANLAVMFKPETTERQLREILSANSARLVDGPTVTGTYLLAIPADQRAPALARIQSEAAVTMAVPLDNGEQH